MTYFYFLKLPTLSILYFINNHLFKNFVLVYGFMYTISATILLSSYRLFCLTRTKHSIPYDFVASFSLFKPSLLTTFNFNPN